MRPCWFLLGCAVAVAAPLPAAPPAAPSPAEVEACEARLRADLRFLTSPACEGRAVGTKGSDLAAEYIAREFDKAGLRPAGQGWFQPFDLAVSARRGPVQQFQLHGPLGQTITLEHGTHFFVPFASTSGEVASAPLVFAGYGLKNRQAGYDDYAGLDVKGKAVVVIDGAPRRGEAFPPFIRLAVRAREARERGAVALLVVNARPTGADDVRERSPFSLYAGQPGGLPVLRLRRDLVDRMLFAARGLALAEVEQEISAAYAPRSGPLAGWTCRLKTDVKHTTVRVKNVVGTLPGSGPLADETVVIGAHYDHVGLAGVPYANAMRPRARFLQWRSVPGSIGGVGFPLTQMFGPAFHPGADDNASGTVAVLELARRFAAREGRTGRRLVFIAFTAEEGGLHGSAHYCQRPLYPIEKTAAMLNMDMVGRLQDGKLRVSGLGTAKAFAALVDRHGEGRGLVLTKKDTIDGATDHLSFFDAGVPVLSFFTGFHEQYHRPTDRFETINVPGLRQVAALVGDLAEELTVSKERPAYVPHRGTFERTKTLWASAPCTGILSTFQGGVVVDGVVPKTPAERAGLRQGDRVLRAAGKPVHSAADFLNLSRTWGAGQRVELTVLRQGRQEAVTLQLAREPTGLEEAPALLLGLTPDYGETDGARVMQVRPRGPADRAGLRADDMIREVNGRPVATLEDFLTAIEGIRPGSQYRLKLSRQGQALDATLTAAAAPAVGFAVGPREGRQGLYLVDVAKDGPAARAGLAEGDRLVSLDGKPVASAQAFGEAVLALRDSARVAVEVDGTPLTRVLRLGPPQKKPPDAPAVAAIVHEALQRFEAPGAAVGIVRDGAVVHLAGYGRRDREAGTPVTPDTLFAIGSCSKAFTAAAIGALVEEGKMSWEGPVRKHLPGFRLHDPLADRDVTVRDLLSHRTGVVRHDILWLVHPGWGRDELIRRAGLLRQDKPFRSEFGYNNLQYLMAGEAAARAAGTTWEGLVRTRLLAPLGMKTSNLSTTDLVQAPDFARPYERKNGDGPVEAVPPRNLDNIAPAGAINSSAREMTAWLRLLLDEGAFAGKRLLKPATVRALFKPVAVDQPGPEMEKVFQGVTVQATYALGWRIMDYRGRRMVSHGGAIDGYRALVVLLPEQRIGIVVLCNLGGELLPEAVAYPLADLLLGAQKRDWLGACQALSESAREERRKRERAVVQGRQTGTRPALALDRYAGTFEEPAHGTVTIRHDNGKLSAHWGCHTLPLEHWHHNTWRLGDPGGTKFAWGDRLLNFRLNNKAEVEAFEFLGYEFRKAKPR
jgi:CubicO group peptidase (beta-lactamase class C family)/Zn-dependent M28 family amino/carboxypeptidase